ncbi:Acyl transferase domain-containing protein [Chitinophaga sp. CF118]|nr:Acyl transferase domain-containing protein [Chitinophaga sp. CF118]
MKEQQFTSIYTGTESFLADHKIREEKILPGVAYLEMARAAGEVSVKEKITQLKGVTWLSPVRVNGTPEKIHISVYPAGEEIAYRIFSQQGEEQLHNQGRLGTGKLYAPANHDLDDIRHRLSAVKEHADCYRLFAERGLQYGTSFRGISKLYYSEEEALSKITLPPEEGFVLTPGILDSALQTSMGMRIAAKDYNLVIPFSVREVNIYSELPAEIWCYARKSKYKNANNAITGYDIDIVNDAGTILLSFTDIVMLSPEKEQTDDEPATHLYHYVWEEKLPVLTATDETQLILLAGGTSDLADKLKDILGVEVVSLPEGDAITFFTAVFDRLKKLFTTQSATQVIVVFNNPDYHYNAFISGLLKTTALENRKISGKVIGVDDLSVKQLSALVQILETERETADVEVSYREGVRMVKVPVPVVSGTERLPVKEGGVYLITGGAGGLGKLFAEHISQVPGTTIVLTGRSIVPPQTLGKIPGAIYHSCDVTDMVAVKALISMISTTYHRLDGIIHSAGIIRDSFIINKSGEEIRQVLLPKIEGAINLDEATKTVPLDFMVFFSSVAGVYGNVGQADYAAANAWLDNYACYRNQEQAKGKRSGKTLSINWPLWKEGGMNIGGESEQLLEKHSGMLPLPSAEGLMAFDILLNNIAGQVLVAYGKKDRLRKKLFATKAFPVAETIIADTSLIDLREQTIGKIREIAAALLKLSVNDIETDQELGDYGFDSVLMTLFSNQLNSCYDLELMPTVFYNYPTVEDLAVYLLEEHKNSIIKYHVAVPSLPIVSAPAKETPQLTAPVGLSPIAIIGMEGRFPGSPDLSSFWNNIVANKDLITEIPLNRWDWRKLDGDPDRDKNKTRIKWGGFIDDIDKFDPLFFGISPKEAAFMDPQQRITLEAVYHALEDAGISPGSIKGSNTGVFIGVSNMDYSWLMQHQPDLTSEAQFPTGIAHAMLVNRISYLLDLHGPSVPIDTACSSALVAIHRAVESIRSGHCEIAIAGGVNVILSPVLTLSFGQAGMLSEDGHCKTFDQEANGYVRGEGVGVIILKSLQQAEADGDHIYGVIRSSAENHGGKANTLTSPNPVAQKDLLLKAYRLAGIDPRDVSYIEAHGTGTSLGDPIETEGLKEAFNILYQDFDLAVPATPYCALGSVKTNIGHLEAAAGIAGLLKVLLSIKHRILPGNPHLKTPNRYLKLTDTPFYLQKESSVWKTENSKPRIAGVSSFGFGGANAHVVVEEYLSPLKKGYTDNAPAVIVLSAKSKEQLTGQVTNLHRFLVQHPDTDLYDVAYTLQTGREHMQERLAMIVADKTTLMQQLAAYPTVSGNIVFTGNVRKDKPGEPVDAGSPIENARLWTQGIPVNWSSLYTVGKPSRISLPGYPFLRQRYWIPSEISHVLPPQEKGICDVHVPVWNRITVPSSVKSLTGKYLLVANGKEHTLTGSLKNTLEETGNVVELPTGLSPLPAGITHVYLLDGLAEAGVMNADLSIFRTMKELLSSGYREKNLKITVFTYRTQKVSAFDKVNANGGGIAGLMGSLAKEQPLWDIRVIDLSTGDITSKDIDLLQTAPYDKDGGVIAYRHQSFYQRSLYSLQLPVPQSGRIRQGGTYVILGGAGGIGKVTTAYLVKHYQAQVIWLGRSKINEQISNAQQEIEKLGIKPLYIQCDANDRTDMENVRLEIKTAHPVINGLFHAAIVLNDMLLKDMTEDDFLKSFSPKSTGSHHFINSFKNESLDFICFYSSLQSQWNAAGQANYSAGCTYKDSYAEVVREELHLPVYTINWGYWGDVGIVATDVYRRKMEQMGVGSITAAEGMEMLECVLAGQHRQVVAMKRTGNTLIHFIRGNRSLVKISAESLLRVHDPVIKVYDSPENAEAAFLDLCAKGILQVLLLMNIDKTAVAGITVAEVRKKLQIIEKYDRLFTTVCQLLEKHHYIREWAIPERTTQQLETFHLTSAISRLVSEQPEFASRCQLLQICLSAFQDILRGVKNATDIIFPGGSFDYVSNIYKGNYQSDYFNDLLADIVLASVAQGVKDLLPGEKIRILEVGAGTGGTTERIFKKLTPYKEHITYVYTDLSRSFLLYAEETFRKDAPYLETALFNIEKSPEEQGFSVGSHDIVIGANVVHATKDISTSLSNIKGLLKGGGLLLLNEIAGTELFTTLTFGLLDGWWLYEDAGLRLPGSPGLSAEGWYTALTDAGYEQVKSYPENSKLSQQIILACSDGIVVKTLQGQQEKTPVPVVIEKAVNKDWLTARLVTIAAGTIMIPEKELDVEGQFRDYGFDSILGTTLVKNINAAFNITLKPTDIYNYPNISRLSDFIQHTYLKSATQERDNRFTPPAASVATDAIAVIGISCGFGDASNPDEYWSALRDGRSMITEVPAERWDIDEHYSPDPDQSGKSYSKWGSFLKDIDKFDPLFFRISGSEAELMDPRQRLFLMHCWKAIEDAGISPRKLASARCGVYVGAAPGDYVNDINDRAASAMWGNSNAILASRISYLLDLRGPAIAVDTACSSSLVSMDMGYKSLQSGETDIVISGGVNVMNTRDFYTIASRSGMLSPTGQCYTFDQRADGFVPGEGVGVVIMKRLADAERDGDHIYGVIRGSAVNQDGTSNGITAPNVLSQIALQKEVYNRFNINPETIGYIETHGTGTRLGDPVEFDALTASFRAFTDKKQFCGLASVKTNIGHTLAAAGVAGVIKLLLALKYKQLPPSLNYTTCNPLIDLENSPFKIQLKLEDWLPEDGVPRRAAISSFGFSGTNAHMVIEEYNPVPQTAYQSNAPAIILLSAKNQDRLKEMVGNLKNHLLVHSVINLHDIAYTLQTGREAMEERMALVVESKEELLSKLTAWLQGSTVPVFKGNVKRDGNDFMLEGGAGKAYISYAILHREVTALAQLWVKGIQIDWTLLYEGESPRKVSLPAYPFAIERYWLPEIVNKEIPAIHRLHPLLHVNESDLLQQQYAGIYTGKELFLREHKVRGEMVLPAVAYLEMAIAAGEKATRHKITLLKDVSLQQAVTVRAIPRKIQIRLLPQEENITYEVYTGENDQETVHSQGKLYTQPLAVPEMLDLDGIRKRLFRSMSKDACYHAFREMGMDYGPAFQGIEQLWFSEEEALSRITLSAQKEYILSPGLLDSAIQTCAGLNFARENHFLALPFSIGEIKIYQDLPTTVWSYVRRSTLYQSPKEGISHFDILVLNEEGEVLLEFNDLVMVSPDGGNVKRSQASAHVYLPLWQEKAAVINNTINAVPLILLAGSSADLADKLTVRLETSVIALPQTTTIAYFLDVMERMKTVTDRHVIIVCSNADYLEYSFVAGILKTANRENSRITGKILGVDQLSVKNLELLVSILETEQFTTDTEVQYLDGKRVVKRLVPASSPVMKEHLPIIKEGGVYLITGGAGGLGQIFAQHISKTAGTRIILTGTSQLSEEKVALFSGIPNSTYHRCDISDRTATIALIKEVLATAGKLDGIIHSAGVVKDSFIVNKTKEAIAAVGAPKITGLQYLDEATKDIPLDFMVFFSAVAGVLGNPGQADYAAANHYLDNYAQYRNKEKAKGNRSGKTISISWPLWQEGGMQVPVEKIAYLEKYWGMLPLPTVEGVRVFESVLNNNYEHAIILYGRQEAIAASISREDVLESAVTTIAPLSESVLQSNKADLNRNDTQLHDVTVDFLKEILSDELKIAIDKFEPSAPFEQYGIDSVLITRLNHRFDILFGRVPSTLFFEYRTLNELAGYFAGAHAGKIRELSTPQPVIVPAERSVVQRFATTPAPKVEKQQPATGVEEIAIVGLSGRYPGADNIHEFWNNLQAGKDCITEIPADRWDVAGFYGEGKGKSYSKWGGFINDVDKFDPAFFNISPRDALQMDPQERLFLQVAWEAIEDGGYTRSRLNEYARKGITGMEGNVGVYVGVMYEEYQLFGAEETLKGNPLPLLGNPGSIANRVSYFLNLHGPSIAIDTMCSSSLTAIHLACRDILSGDTSMAIAGGVNVSIHPNKYLLLSQGKFVSGKGRCESFGEGGEGYVPGEGVGAVLLKKLSQAIADGDQIYGVIKGSALNHGGKTNGYTVPNPNAQAAVIRDAMKKAGVTPEQFSYIEAHGTGTSLGDPIEIAGLVSAFNTDKKQFCNIGSVKSNIGHCESAAGVSGLTKVLLQLKHRQLVPSLHSSKLNHNIDFSNTPFRVQQTVEKWEAMDNKPRLAGISGFGAGGSNAHIIIEEYLPVPLMGSAEDGPAIIVLSARDADRLRMQVLNLKQYLEKQESGRLHNIAYTLQVGRESMEERLAFVAADKADLLNKLNAYLNGDTAAFLTGNIQSFTTKPDLKEQLRDAVNKKALPVIADLWIKGMPVDWPLLYTGALPQRISLPLYPFYRKRYWFDNRVPVATPALPLIDVPSAKVLLTDLQDSLMLVKPSVENVQTRLLTYEPVAETPVPLKTILKETEYPEHLPVANSLFQEVKEVSGQLKIILKEALYLDNNPDENRAFQELGLDSIVGVELVKSINERFNISLAVTKLYDYPTLFTLAAYIQQLLPQTIQVSVPEPVKTIPVSDNNVILQQLKETLKEALYLESDPDENRAFQELGLDSIVGVELIKAINEQFQISLSVTKLYDYPTLKTLTGYIAELMPATTFPVTDVELPVNEKIVAPVEMHAQQDNRVAIIGMSGRYPKAENLAVYWDNISKGMDCVTEVSADRWNTAAHYVAGGELTGEIYSKWLGEMADIDKFDPLFFNISPAEAEMMDPQQRVFLEECWKGLEDAGYNKVLLDGMKCGTYVGIMSNEYAYLVKQSGIDCNAAQLMTGNANSIFAARMAYLLNLKGPAIAIDTACSSSLVATHLACQALLNGEIDMAVAGGVTLYLSVAPYEQMCAAGMLSRDGKCKAFDNSADGFVPGEGVGILILKRLQDAIRDGDDIRGVILGSGINQDGKTNGITAPSVNSQINLLTDIYKKFAIDPATISYVEAHGTGTKLGDPIEAEALMTVFTAFTDKKRYCGIGSVKSNLGHTSAAAGVAGIEKILLQFKAGKLAPTIHFNKENEFINFGDSPFYVNTSLKNWDVPGHQPRRAAVNSFGFSGTNAHLVLEEYIAPVSSSVQDNTPVLIVLSARDKERLEEQVLQLRDFLLIHPDVLLKRVAYTLQTGREAMECRLAFTVTNSRDCIAALSAYLENELSGLFVSDNNPVNIKITYNDLPVLAQAWVNRAQVDWKLLYPGRPPLRISLPAYPFARERYWLSLEAPVSKEGQLHPLLHRNISSLKQQQFTSIYTGKESFLLDHRIGDEKVLPGTAHLELARAAGEQATEEKVTHLKDVTWLSPLTVNGTPEKVNINLQLSDGVLGFEVVSPASGETHSKGILGTGILPAIKPFDLTAIHSRLTHSKQGTDCYNLFKTFGLNYGASFQGISTLYYNENEALARITLPEEKGYLLMPGLLDSALQTCAGIQLAGGRGVLELPFGVSEVNIYETLPATIWSYARKNLRHRTDSKLTYYDVDLLSDNGAVLLSFRDFAVLQAPPAEEADMPKLYTPVWNRMSVSSKQTSLSTGKHLIVSGPEMQFGKDLQRVLLGSNKDVHQVSSLQHLSAGISHIYLLQGLAAVGEEQGYVNRELAVFNIIRELLSSDYREKELHITVLTLRTQKVIASDIVTPGGSGITGLIGSLAKEQPHWHIRVIDVSEPVLNDEGIAGVLATPYDKEEVLSAYRNGFSYQRDLFEMELLAGKVSRLKQGGTYVILGGAGGIGIATTRYLVEKYKAKVIWLGRSALNMKISADIDAVAKLGVKPLYVQCDANDRNSMEDAFRIIKKSHAHINGLFHSAIVLNDMLIKNMSEDDFLRSFLPKSAGSHHFVDVFCNDSLDFICFYSSVQSQWNNPGQSNYAAGCTYKDSYALQLKDTLKIPVHIINWGYWGEVGIVSSEEYREQMKYMGIGSISTTAGMDILEAVLSNKPNQVTALKFV